MGTSSEARIKTDQARSAALLVRVGERRFGVPLTAVEAPPIEYRHLVVPS